MMATPAKPMRTPASLAPVIFSSRVSRCARITVKSGAEALRIEATPEAMCCCPQTISEKGMALLSSPMPKKAVQARRSVGNVRPVSRRIMNRTIAAIATRATTTVNTGISATATALKRKAPPHRTDRASSVAHWAGVMLRAG